MNVLIASDKFKGSLSSEQACAAIKTGVLRFNGSANITIMPLADGGEGSLEAIQSTIKFQRITTKVSDPLFRTVQTWYGLKDDIAYIEMAKASGLLLLKKKLRHAPSTTTLGTGQLIMDALKRGAKTIYLFVGGSATNDGGIGMAQALGYRFLDKKGQKLPPIGASLEHIAEIVDENAFELGGVKVVVVTDVQSLLFGPEGASRVFAKQKGASKSEIEQLDEGLRNLNSLFKQKWGKDISQIPGAGAAGGLGAGAMIFLEAQPQPGIDTIMKILDVDRQIKQADYVITGEGKLDSQTLDGKVIKGIMDRCKHFDVPLGVVCGILDLDKDQLQKLPIQQIQVIRNKNISLHESMKNASYHLAMRSEGLIGQLV